MTNKQSSTDIVASPFPLTDSACLIQPYPYILMCDLPLNNKEQQNIFCRLVEDSRQTAGLPNSIILFEDNNTVKNDDNHLSYEGISSNFVSLSLAVGTHYVFKSKYRRINSFNPFYRNFKTLGSVGTSIGNTIGTANQADVIDLSSNHNFGTILANLLCVGIAGIGSLLYLMIRKCFYKEQTSLENSYALIGMEGWSKYGKTFLNYGINIGQVMGPLTYKLSHLSLKAAIGITAGISGVTSFVLGLLFVPLFNRLTNKKWVISEKTQEAKNKFRNNYIRAGMTLGLAIGSIIGFVIGSFSGVPFNPVIGLTLFGAGGSILLGAVLGKKGQSITKEIQKYWRVDANTDNSWDYAARTCAYSVSFVGAFIGFFFPPFGILLGGAIGSLIGWQLGLYVVKKARDIHPKEQPFSHVAWTQRVATGASIVSILSAGIAAVIGLITGGPAGAMAFGMAGFNLGGALGSVMGAVHGYGLKRVFQSAKTQLQSLFSQKSESKSEPLPKIELSANPNSTNQISKNLRSHPDRPAKHQQPPPSPKISPQSTKAHISNTDTNPMYYKRHHLFGKPVEVIPTYYSAKAQSYVA